MKRFLVLVLCMCAFVMSAGFSFAGDHSSCVVNKVGVYPGLEDQSISRSGYPIFLTCSDLGTSSIMFYLSYDMGDAGLATTLTAMALGQSVWARTTTDTAGGLVTVLYLNAPAP